MLQAVDVRPRGERVLRLGTLARRFGGFALGLGLVACERGQEPPGRSVASASVAPSLPVPLMDAGLGGEPSKEQLEPGQGAKIASIAMRTWIYVAPNDRAAKLGYLRAGAVVDRAEASSGSTGCAGGWYRIAPRGYVCVGKGASLSLDHQVVQAALRGPNRHGLPYPYVISSAPPPHLYFRLPTRSDQERTEGKKLRAEFPKPSSLPPADAVPQFLSEGNDLPKPYGSEEKLHYSVHTGRAKRESAFGLITSFEWTGRRFGLTTELDLIALDRTKPATISEMHGVEVKGEGMPAIVLGHEVEKWTRDEAGKFHHAGVAGFRSGWVLTGKNDGSPHGLLETSEGVWLPADALLTTEFREDPQGYARDGRKWIEVSIKKQMLVAYEGKKPVYATLVSTGRAGMENPETTTATARGQFYIHAKHVSGTMDGAPGSDSFDLRDVPYIQYFHEGYALHAAYWHDDFGKPRSHGCVNLAPIDAAWLFDWTEPGVPDEWHGALNPEGGTLVWIHG